MASENAKIDQNAKKTLTGVTDDAAAEIKRLLVDPTTGRLKVSAVSSGALSSLNGLTTATQLFSTGTAGTNFTISSAGSTHTFDLPTASGTVRGLLSSADWTTFNNKQSAINFANEVPLEGVNDGSNKVFYLSNSPSPATSLILHYNGQIQISGGIMFTLSVGTTVTMDKAPLSTGTLRAWFQY